MLKSPTATITGSPIRKFGRVHDIGGLVDMIPAWYADDAGSSPLRANCFLTRKKSKCDFYTTYEK